MTNHTLQRSMFRTACFMAGTAVILGAFGAHLLKDRLEPDMILSFETGVRYQFIHGLTLLILAGFLRRLREPVMITVYRLFIAGVLLFSGSIYLLSTRPLWTGKVIGGIGVFTPLGGLCMILGWFLLLYKGYRDPDDIRNEDQRKHHHHSSGNSEI